MCAKHSKPPPQPPNQVRPPVAPAASPPLPIGYEIHYTAAAGRELKRLKNNSRVLRSIVATIRTLATNPRHNGVELISGNTYRIRDGEYRIVFEIDDRTRRVLITRVADRKDVYKHRK